MALPVNGTAWPPKEISHIFTDFNKWSAWYSNDPSNLGQAYEKGQASQTRRGIVNRVMDWFWTPRSGDGDAGMTKLHVPIASDLCQVSADLLFSEPPTFTVEDGKGKNKPAQDRLDLIAGDELYLTLVAGAEVAAALSGVYLRATWDKSLFQHVFLTKVDADGAVPTFRYGKLVEVTFWRVVASDGAKVTRHLEHHNVNSFGIGMIEHALYEGRADEIGRRVPLSEHESTKHLHTVVDENSQISTLTPGLGVTYWANITPNRRWRLDPHGVNLGRSDLDGIEPLMDALDRAYSSLMRDLELGKGRLMVPQNMLTDLGPGQGAAFNPDTAIFTGLKAAPGTAADQKMSIEQVQFKIRVEEHLSTVAALFAEIIRAAGYSSQTFGEKDESGGDKTATEVTAKERRSYLTRDRKIRSARPALEAILSKALAMDAVIFNTGAAPTPVTVQFADAVQESLESLARTAQMLKAAEAASRRTLVQLVHPDWDEIQVDAEVARIVAEQPVIADPFAHPEDEDDDGADPAAGEPAGDG